MSHSSKIFNKVPVNVQKRSGFDLSHENLFTAKVGTLIPASVEEVMPGDVVSVGSAVSVELPPLATNFKGRVDARMEAFFVPNRILWGAWQNFICQDQNHRTSVPGYPVPTSIPKVALQPSEALAGTLSDYLGIKKMNVPNATANVNALPYLAYHKIWDDWYRDSLVQQPFFIEGIQAQAAGGISPDYEIGNITAGVAPYSSKAGVMDNTTAIKAYVDACDYVPSASKMGYNGKKLTDLVQRNFAKDYFTTSTTQPQAGAASELQFVIEGTSDSDGDVSGTGSFSIASLRAANSLQKWLERNNIGGTRYYDQILAHYGVLPPDASVNRSVLLGSMTTPVIVNSISQQSQSTNDQIKNPYANSTAAQFGKGTSFGKDRLINNFEVKEHGYIIILFSLVPHAYYSTGCRRYMIGRDTSDTFAFPEFANIGDQPVYKGELWSNDIYYNDIDQYTTFGYAQRYAEYKYHDDEIHGLLQDGESLESFVLQRGFDNSVAISSTFLEIPTSFMDGVMVTTEGVSGFNAVVDCYFDSKFLRCLPEYSLPSLCEGEPDAGKRVYVPKGGTRL